MADARVWSVTSTVPTRDQALDLARAAVAEKLAAGAEVTGPATSVFWHLGELGEGEEWRVTLRTSASARDALAARLAELHRGTAPRYQRRQWSGARRAMPGGWSALQQGRNRQPDPGRLSCQAATGRGA